MRRHRWFLFCLLCCAGSVALGADSRSPTSRAILTPLEDDAALHDVQFVGLETGWAVGDHGVIWKTIDGGMTWDVQASGVQCALRSVCFLTDKIGWVAGGQSLPYVHQGQGVILGTNDGGVTWRQVGGMELPEIQRIKFFTLTHGVAAGELGPQCPSGISITKDGGKTWQSAPGVAVAGWRAADFLGPELGAVAGLRGEHSLFGNGQLVTSKLSRFGLRGLYGLRLLAGGEGWLVGDGGLIRHQEKGGVVWEAPPGALPREVQELFDFRAVAVRGMKIWVAGDPGSVIWHSKNGGRTWKAQQTLQTLPIAALSFPSDEVGWAVGALGSILQSTDGGETWLPVRGADRRAAYLAALSHVDRVSMPLIATASGEHGFRGVISILPRYDRGGDAIDSREVDLKLAEATMLAGGSASQISWRLPIDIPGLELNSERLIAEWTKRSEGALQDQLVAQAVRQLRTWRPSVVVIDEPGPHDALARLVRDTLLQAIPQAADPAAQMAQQEVANLPVWQVERIFVRLPPGSQGQVNIGAFDMLSRQGCAVQIAAAPALARLQHEVIVKDARESYRAVSLLDGKPAEYRGQDFFAKLGLSPGTATRRTLPLIEDEQHARKLKLAQLQRNFLETVKRSLANSDQGSYLIAQLSRVTQGMPDDQAALMLAQLADAYRQQGQWDLAEATLVDMVERFPHQPAAQDAMRWLVQLWSSGELAYQRLKISPTNGRVVTVDTGEFLRRQNTAGQRLPTNESTLADDIELSGGKRVSLVAEEFPVKLETGSRKELRQERLALWQDKARRLASQLQRTSPAWYRSPEIQMPLASLFRKRQLESDANECFHFIMRGGEQTPWQRTAATELWLNQMAGVPPKTIYGCRIAGKPPQLNGLLDDECWRAAAEMPLAGTQSDGPLRRPALVLLCHDEEYLYFAGVCPRIPEAPSDLPERTGRQFDADLGAYDRVTLTLDTDRDYVTAYRLTIDQRGYPNDDLWGDAHWNPKWYVAADGDESAWRFEVAIPWKELVDRAPVPGTVWAANVVRTVPAQGTQSWTGLAAGRPKLEAGGLLKIE